MDSGSGFVLILAVVFAAYRTLNPVKKRVIVSTSVVLGLIGTVISVILRSIPNYINRTRFAFWSMIPVVAALFLLLLLLALERRFGEKYRRVYENLLSAAVLLYISASIFYYLPLIAALQTAFVYYGESAVSTLVLFRVIGFTMGILVLVLSFIAVYKTLSKLSRTELIVTVCGALFILGITQIVVILQRLYSMRIIPKNRAVFSFIAFVVNNNRYFVLGVIVFIMIAPLLLWKKNIRMTEPYANKAELRKLKASKRNARRWSGFLVSLLIFNVLSLTLIRFYVDREIPLSPPEDYLIEEGTAVIPLSELADGHLHRYEYKSSDGIVLRFIAIKKSEGSYGVCLDACDICGPSGYFERKGEVICKLCDVVMNKGTIGFPGGCNPVPIPYMVHDGKVKIYTKDLDAEAYRFK